MTNWSRGVVERAGVIYNQQPVNQSATCEKCLATFPNAPLKPRSVLYNGFTRVRSCFFLAVEMPGNVFWVVELPRKSCSIRHPMPCPCTGVRYPLSRPIPTDHLPLPSIRPVFPVLQLAAPSTFSYPSPVVESVVICPVGCFISNLFSPILSSRTNSRYFVHLVNFGVSHSFLKQISW